MAVAYDKEEIWEAMRKLNDAYSTALSQMHTAQRELDSAKKVLDAKEKKITKLDALVDDAHNELSACIDELEEVHGLNRQLLAKVNQQEKLIQVLRGEPSVRVRRRIKAKHEQ